MTTFPRVPRWKPVGFTLYWNPLHPSIGFTQTIQTLVLLSIPLTMLLAVLGVDVAGLMYLMAASLGAVSIGILKTWQTRFSPISPTPTE